MQQPAASQDSPAPAAKRLTPETAGTASLTLYFDGGCPLCAHEMRALQARDTQQRLQFVDIHAPGFDPAPTGLTIEELDAAMTARDADGRLLRGLDALHAAWAAAGCAALYRWTRHPRLRPLTDRLYTWFARHRHRISRLLAPLLRWLPGSAAPVCETARCRPLR